jgi:uncharacterized protein (DUF2235 family)
MDGLSGQEWVSSMSPAYLCLGQQLCSFDPPSNVTRISRVIRPNCQDGTHQIIMYHPGVGSADNAFDQFSGGAFGMGLDEVSEQ